MVGEGKEGEGEWKKKYGVFSRVPIHPVRSNRKSNMAAQWTMALALPNKTPALQATVRDSFVPSSIRVVSSAY